jgi:hypothetical protein
VLLGDTLCHSWERHTLLVREQTYLCWERIFLGVGFVQQVQGISNVGKRARVQLREGTQWNAG